MLTLQVRELSVCKTLSRYCNLASRLTTSLRKAHIYSIIQVVFHTLLEHQCTQKSLWITHLSTYYNYIKVAICKAKAPSTQIKIKTVTDIERQSRLTISLRIDRKIGPSLFGQNRPRFGPFISIISQFLSISKLTKIGTERGLSEVVQASGECA